MKAWVIAFVFLFGLMTVTGMTTAQTTIYQCVVDGVKVFSSLPCVQEQIDQQLERQPAERRSVQSKATQQPLTGPQRNAVRSAQRYLEFKGFSRRGLILQLSSDFGDSYTVADATRAVDSVNVDWNEQAVRAARAYLEFQGFSCQGLIRQLSSDHGDRFTESQARHGAQRAGAC